MARVVDHEEQPGVVTDLNSRTAAQIVVSASERVANRAIEKRLPRIHYGVVFGDPDRASRKVAVRLMGQDEPSAGFVYGNVEPRDGDLVRVFIEPKGDRYVDDVLGRDFAVPVVDTLPEATAMLRGVLLLLAGGTGVADALYVCRRAADGTYGWAAL